LSDRERPPDARSVATRAHSIGAWLVVAIVALPASGRAIARAPWSEAAADPAGRSYEAAALQPQVDELQKVVRAQEEQRRVLLDRLDHSLQQIDHRFAAELEETNGRLYSLVARMELFAAALIVVLMVGSVWLAHLARRVSLLDRRRTVRPPLLGIRSTGEPRTSPSRRRRSDPPLHEENR
jgi:hypothetical protein